MRATPPPETSKDAIVTAAALLIGGGIVWLGVNSMVRLFTFAKRIPGRVLSVGVVERHVPTWVEVEYVLMDQTIREVVPVPDTDGARLKAGDSITLVVDLQSGTAAYNPALAAALPEWSPLKGK